MMEGATKKWGVGWRVAWIGLTLSFFIPLRASELFAEDDNKMCAVYCLRGEDGGFLCGRAPVERRGLPIGTQV